MRAEFPLFQSHLDLAHSYWCRLLLPDDSVLDATCGNGHDALALAQFVPEGRLFVCDIQETALRQTKELLSQELPDFKRLEFLHSSHSEIGNRISPETLGAVVYNLGYLPGADKSLTTELSSTLSSIQQALSWIRPGGFISVTCYPGHEEGAREEEALLEYFSSLSPKEWSICHHRWVNRRRAPSLFLLQAPYKSVDKRQAGRI